jgi:uncharacterized protein YndB with AHSA1/START domain
MSIRISVSARINASSSEVWAALENIESHVQWMKDAESIRFTTAGRTGTGNRVRLRHEGGSNSPDRRDVDHRVEAL